MSFRVTESTAASGINPSTASGPPPFDKGGKSGDGGPPSRGMSRSDKGSAGSGEDGKVTSGQEGLQPVAPLRSQDRLAFLPTAKPFRRYADTPITFQGKAEESLQLKKHKNNCSTESCRAKILTLKGTRRLVTLAQNDILPL